MPPRLRRWIVVDMTKTHDDTGSPNAAPLVRGGQGRTADALIVSAFYVGALLLGALVMGVAACL